MKTKYIHDELLERASDHLAQHILPTSATMVGVCLTGIGLVKLAEEHIGPSHVDEALAVTSLIFCISTLLSYRALSFRGHPIAVKLERWADVFFSMGMISMVIICMLFAFDIV